MKRKWEEWSLQKKVFFMAWERPKLSKYMVFGGHDMRVIQDGGSLDSVMD